MFLYCSYPKSMTTVVPTELMSQSKAAPVSKQFIPTAILKATPLSFVNMGASFDSVMPLMRLLEMEIHIHF